VNEEIINVHQKIFDVEQHCLHSALETCRTTQETHG
jgi:hypothetical protein